MAKRYKINRSERYLTLRDKMMRGLSAPIDYFAGKGKGRGPREEFYALHDVSFDVSQGEVVGIIGRNGAGKTTLLKVLSRITYPTKGRVNLYGRVASLLEVGTGFHSELSGRENIYFNGSVLGMKRAEINRKFDDIVEFSEIGKFLDTPVKRYSSGMQMRLAFSVAAFLEPEVLVIDEVLAVGDLMFQKKCLGKMDEVAKTGRTVLFVSHNLEAVERLCSRAILLQSGRIIDDGPVLQVLSNYVKAGADETGEKIWKDPESAPGDDVVRMHAVRVIGTDGKPCIDFDVGDPVSVEMEYWVLRDGYSLDAAIFLYNERNQIILVSLDNLDSPWTGAKRPRGKYRSVCTVPKDFLNNGQVSLLAAVCTHPQPVHVILRDVLRFNVKDSMELRGVRGNYPVEWPAAAVRPRLQWRVECEPLE